MCYSRFSVNILPNDKNKQSAKAPGVLDIGHLRKKSKRLSAGGIPAKRMYRPITGNIINWTTLKEQVQGNKVLLVIDVAREVVRVVNDRR